MLLVNIDFPHPDNLLSENKGFFCSKLRLIFMKLSRIMCQPSSLYFNACFGNVAELIKVYLLVAIALLTLMLPNYDHKNRSKSFGPTESTNK